MIFEMGAAPPEPRGVSIGDVYPARGGRGPTRYWLVLAVRDRRCAVLGLDPSGQVVTAHTYHARAFEERERVGHCPDVEAFSAAIMWDALGEIVP